MKRRGKEERPPRNGTEGQSSLDDAIDEVTDGVEGEAMGDDGEDRFDVMAAEIASLFRSAQDASRRLESEAAARAKATLVEAETRKGEADALIAEARERNVSIRREADEYADARRAELAELTAAATSTREASAETLDKARKLLSETEQELTKIIDQATAALAALSAIRAASAPVEAEQKALDDSAASEVVDLTDDKAETAAASEPEA